MLRDILNAKQQIKKWAEHQTYFLPFTAEDWDHLQQHEHFLARIEDFTVAVSKCQSRISLAIPIYYGLHDLLYDSASREGEFSDLHPEIAAAASAGLKKFQKYYDLMAEKMPIIWH
jgi:trans-aconitate methyltransferase